MGPEASLKLLDLSQDANIDDANQAYAYLHRMIDLFYQDAGTENQGERQEDMELLSCAYEKAVAYLSDRDPLSQPSSTMAPEEPSAVEPGEPTDLHFTINFSAGEGSDEGVDDVQPLSEPNTRTIEEAISITSRRVHEAESALPSAKRNVEAATQALAAANRRHDSAKQASLTVMVAAKSAKTRALLLELEAKRAMKEAIAVAEKAQARAAAAQQVAEKAKDDADKARDQVVRVRKSEETAAAEAVCAEDRLEKQKVRLKTLTHTLLAARERRRLFQETTSAITTTDFQASLHCPPAIPDNRVASSSAMDGEDEERQRIMSDLLDIEESLNVRKREPVRKKETASSPTEVGEPDIERRQHRRLVYPLDHRPQLIIDGRSVDILDLSTGGMRLQADDAVPHLRIVRGTIDFAGRQPLVVTGKVVRQDASGLGVKLVTRIGSSIIDQERLRLSA